MPATEPTDQLDGSIDSDNERTKQEFEKLKARNKELSEKLTQLEEQQVAKQSVLDELLPRANDYGNLTPSQVSEIAEDLIDEQGYVDMSLLKKTLAEQNTRARKAEERADQAIAKVEKFEQNQQVSKAHELYPQLDPYSQKFDPRFYKAVKNELVEQMMNGKQDMIGAANAVTEWFYPKSQTQAQAPQESKKEVVTQREQTVSVGSNQPVSEDDEHDNLVEGTLKGDNTAIGERLMRSGY